MVFNQTYAKDPELGKLFANKDFRLKAGAAAIDAGTVVEPYTAGFVCSVPQAAVDNGEAMRPK